jgi:A/G-specific adenine glycosylase
VGSASAAGDTAVLRFIFIQWPFEGYRGAKDVATPTIAHGRHKVRSVSDPKPLSRGTQSSGSCKRLRVSLLEWYRRERRDLPWRRTTDPYAVWVSETMLQQTRVETALPYYERFLRALPTVGALAEAPEESVLGLWSGLGYYRRARMLHAGAKRVIRTYGGRLPSDLAELRRIEGIGPYTAGAVASIAFGRRAAVVDGNVARVLARLFAIEDDVKSARGSARLWRLAESLVTGGDGSPGDWNQALMELGATVCVPREPRCGECPLRGFCAGLAGGRERELPRASPKRKPTAVRLVAVVLQSARAVLLARRRPDTLFGGLWEPPNTEAGLQELATALGVDADALERVGEVTHVLSHRRMHVEVVRGVLPRRRRWKPPTLEYDAIEAVAIAGVRTRAHAALTLKVLAVANVPAHDLTSTTK